MWIPDSYRYEGGTLLGARNIGDNEANGPRSLCGTEAELKRSWIRLRRDTGPASQALLKSSEANEGFYLGS